MEMEYARRDLGCQNRTLSQLRGRYASMVTDYRRELNEFDYANFDGGNVDVGTKPHGVHGI